MNKANISYTRNHLSEILARVKEGESILILDRTQPVARLEPATASPRGEADGIADLVRRGLVKPARERINSKALGAMPLPSIHGSGDILNALMADRENGR